VKTEAQRLAIVQAATSVFQELGYQAASMNRVAAKIGGSKGTLYNYFSSKEELFAEAMTLAVRPNAAQAFAELKKPGKRTLTEVLERFGVAYLRFYLAPEMLEITRLAISEGKDGGLGALLYKEGVLDGWKQVVDFLEPRLNTDRLPKSGIWTVALQYRALLMSDLIERRLRGVISTIEEDTLKQVSADAAALIYHAYGLDNIDHPPS
jgi:AcrR family transcriptional regulator